MLTNQELSILNKLTDTQNPRFSSIFKVLSDPNRCKIMRIILKNPEGNLCVGDFAKVLKVSTAAASQALKQLQTAELLLKERKGQKVFFKPILRDPLVRAIANAIK